MVTSIISDGRSYPGVTEAAISGAIDRICKEDNNKVNILLSSRVAAPSDGSSENNIDTTIHKQSRQGTNYRSLPLSESPIIRAH